MNDDAFWSLIEHSRQPDALPEDRLDLLREELARRSPEEVVGFQVVLEQVTDRAYTWELWAAADRVLDGYCSDDGFFYFRLWLVGCGRAAYEQVLADPDALAVLPGIRSLAGRPKPTWCETAEWPEWEELDYVAAEAYEELTGEDAEEGAFYDEVDDAKPADVSLPGASPTGTRWPVRDESEATRRLPRLSALFPLS